MFRKLTQLGAVIAPLVLAAITIVALAVSASNSLQTETPMGARYADLGGVALKLVAETHQAGQSCTETRAQFDAFNEAQAKWFGNIHVTDLPAEIAKPYFVELDKFPPASKTLVDTALLIEVQRFPQVVWVAAVHDGMVCNRWRITRVAHETIMTIAASSPKATGLKI